MTKSFTTDLSPLSASTRCLKLSTADRELIEVQFEHNSKHVKVQTDRNISPKEGHTNADYGGGVPQCLRNIPCTVHQTSPCQPQSSPFPLHPLAAQDPPEHQI